jgi:hypothetical protein
LCADRRFRQVLRLLKKFLFKTFLWVSWNEYAEANLRENIAMSIRGREKVSVTEKRRKRSR